MDLQGLLHVIKGGYMKDLNKKELLNVEGGSSITSGLISSLVKGASVFLEVGRSLGSSLRRIVSSRSCKL